MPPFADLNCGEQRVLLEYLRDEHGGSSSNTFDHEQEHAPDTAGSITDWLDNFDTWRPHWEGVAQRVLDANPDASVAIIPAGQVLKVLQERVLNGSLTLPGGLTFRETFFKRNRPGLYGGCGTRDHIHPGRVGLYAIALTHYATIYCTSPVGLPSIITFPDYDDGCVEVDTIIIDNPIYEITSYRR